MRTRSALLLAATLACTRKLEGPLPAPAATAPAAACVLQKTTTIDLTGAGFSPLYTGALGTGRVELPAILLTRRLDLSGSAVADAPVTIPDDPDAPAQSHERWLDDGHLQFTVDPSLALTPGLYDVGVVNASNGAGTLAGGLLAVPPPTLNTIAPDLACDAKGNTFLLGGSGFLVVGTKTPSVALGTKTYPSVASNCRALPGSAGIQSCTQLSITVPSGDLPTGDYPVLVTNPDPVGCKSSAPGPIITLVGPPSVTNVIPPSVCSAATALPLTIQGAGFLTIAPPGKPLAAPTVVLGGKPYQATPGGCTALPHSPEAVQVCTSLVINVNGPDYAVGSYPLTVTNPAPADCTSSPAVQVAVTPPPVVTSLTPATICQSRDTFVLAGTGFESNASVTATATAAGGGTVQAANVTINGAGTSATVTMPALIATGNYQVSLNNPDGCSASPPTLLHVTPGPTAFFVDPSIIYNGITVQATLYAGGISPPVKSIVATPTGGGTSTTLAFTSPAPNRAQITIPKGLPPGSYDLTVRDQSTCPAILTSAFTVVDQTTLALATPAVTPPFGAFNSSTGVTIQGTGFISVPRVYLNPSNPGPGTVATALGAVSFVDASHLTALVPGTLPAGSYDVIVVNPDGKVGVATNAFAVADAAHPPPTISTITPGSVATGSGAPVTVLGSNFRNPAVTLSCFDSAGAPLSPPPSVAQGASSATSITFTPGPTAAASCVVRVTDQDNLTGIVNTYAEYSALVFTNSSANLYPPLNGPDLTVARRAPVALGGDATTAARFLHVAGGDAGSGAAFDTVETSALTFIGVPGGWTVQRNHLSQPRAFAGGVRIGRWLYLAGGSSTGAALGTVERAFVLDPASARRTQVTDLALDVDPSVGLASGVYYYRVAAVMPAGDAFNPAGEELPSDPLPVRLPALTPVEKFSVTLTWQAVPGAASYVVYRSPTPNAAAGTEVAVQRITAPTTTFTDIGAAALAGAPPPLPVGSLGTWKALPFAMNTAREGPGVTVAIDPNNAQQAYLYVLGGRSSPTVASDTYEYVPIALQPDGSQPFGTVPAGGGTVTAASAFTQPAASIGGARWQLMAPTATNALAPIVPAGTTYIYAGPGVSATGTVLAPVTVAQVQAGGTLGTFAAANSAGSGRAGYVGLVAAGQVLLFGGKAAAPDAGVDSAAIGTNSSPPPALKGFNAGQTMNVARYLAGGTLHGAYIYIVGGLSTGSTPTASTEYRVW